MWNSFRKFSKFDWLVLRLSWFDFTFVFCSLASGVVSSAAGGGSSDLTTVYSEPVECLKVSRILNPEKMNHKMITNPHCMRYAAKTYSNGLDSLVNKNIRLLQSLQHLQKAKSLHYLSKDCSCTRSILIDLVLCC
jgi:hypothetical protein